MRTLARAVVGVWVGLLASGQLGAAVIANYQADYLAGTSNGQTRSERQADGWDYMWNSGGAIGAASNYSSLKWYSSGNYYTPNGVAYPQSAPAGYLHLYGSGGHPGYGSEQTGSGGIDRYAIAAYTVQAGEAGYVYLNGNINVNSSSSNGVEVRVYVNDNWKLTYVQSGGTSGPFRAYLGALSVGDKVYVAVGPNTSHGSDSFSEFQFFLAHPEVWWDADGAAPVGGSGSWDTSNSRWAYSSTGGVYSPWDNSANMTAHFAGTAGVVTLAAPITASALGFYTNGYTIAGDSALTLTDAGAGSLGAATIHVANAGDTATISAPIAGSAGLTKTGPGVLVLSGSNTYTGVTTIAAGTLRLGNESALGAATGKTVIQAGATLDINGYRAGAASPGNEPIEVQGSGVGGAGALVNNGASDQTQAFSNITLLGDTTFGGSRRWDARSGTLNANGYTITKVGGNTVCLKDMTVQNPGNVIVNGGTFRLETATNFNGASGQYIQIASGARFDFWNSSQTFTFNVILNGGQLTANGGGSPTVSGAIQLNSTSSLEAATEYGNTTLTLSGKITGPGGATIKGYVSSGYNGTLVFSNTANDYAGNTDIQSGTLRLGASEVIPHGAGKGNVILNGVASGAAGTLDLNGCNETINGLSGSSNTILGQVVNNKSGTTATLTVGAGDATASFAGTLANNTGTGGTLALIKTGAGIQTLSGPLNYTGGTTVNGGTLVLARSGLGWTDKGQFGANHVITVNAGATLQLTQQGILGMGQAHQLIINGGTVEFQNQIYQSRIEMTGGRIVSTASNYWRVGNAGNGQITVKASSTSSTIENYLMFVKSTGTKTTFDVEDGTAAQDLIVSANIVDHPDGFEGMELVKTGAGTMVLSGNNTYIGPTTIQAGKLLLTGTHTPATTPGVYTVAAGGTLGGTGTTSAPVLVQGTIAPGASVGVINTGSETWAPAGTYQWEIQDVDAGPGVGWDLINITGTLTITATAANPFVIDVVSLGGGGGAGLVGDFNPLSVYSWEIARTTGGVSGFAQEKFLVDLGDFQNYWHGGRWWVSQQGNSVYLNYAIPEPSSGLLAALALAGLALWRWMSRNPKTPTA